MGAGKWVPGVRVTNKVFSCKYEPSLIEQRTKEEQSNGTRTDTFQRKKKRAQIAYYFCSQLLFFCLHFLQRRLVRVPARLAVLSGGGNGILRLVDAPPDDVDIRAVLAQAQNFQVQIESTVCTITGSGLKVGRFQASAWSSVSSTFL